MHRHNQRSSYGQGTSEQPKKKEKGGKEKKKRKESLKENNGDAEIINGTNVAVSSLLLSKFYVGLLYSSRPPSSLNHHSYITHLPLF